MTKNKLHKRTDAPYWVRFCIFIKPWEKFLIENTTAIDPLQSTEIKAEPNPTSATIRKSTKEDCFEAIEIKGDWMRVRTNETLDCSEHPTPIPSGWIRWRLADQLLIKYYLTCWSFHHPVITFTTIWLRQFVSLNKKRQPFGRLHIWTYWL